MALKKRTGEDKKKQTNIVISSVHNYIYTNILYGCHVLFILWHTGRLYLKIPNTYKELFYFLNLLIAFEVEVVVLGRKIIG